jgi:hypothetical protein
MSTLSLRRETRRNMKVIGYWTGTAVVAGELLGGGVASLLHGRTLLVGKPLVQPMQRLGYPAYLLTILGVCKLLGGIALLAPRFPRRKRMGLCRHLLGDDRGGGLACSVRRFRGRSLAPALRRSHAHFVGASTAKPDPGSPLSGS